MRNGKLWSNEHCNHSRRHSTRSTLGIATLSVQFALLLSRVWLGDAVLTAISRCSSVAHRMLSDLRSRWISFLRAALPVTEPTHSTARFRDTSLLRARPASHACASLRRNASMLHFGAMLCHCTSGRSGSSDAPRCGAHDARPCGTCRQADGRV